MYHVFDQFLTEMIVTSIFSSMFLEYCLTERKIILLAMQLGFDLAACELRSVPANPKGVLLLPYTALLLLFR